MTTFNPLYYTYATRRNVPLADSSATDNLRASYLFAFKTLLTGEATGGTQSGTRAANSLWTHVASSDGSTFSTVTDLWGTTFNNANFVWNPVGFPSFNGNQSWIVLQNTAVGYQICISCSYNASGYAGVSFTPISAPFSGFSATSRPYVANLIAVHERPNPFGYGYGWNGFYSDLTLGGYYYAHFVTNSVDGQFWFLVNRAGQGCFNFLLGLQKTVDNDPSDTRNVFALSSSMAINYQSARGAGRSDMFVADYSAFDGQNKDGSIINNSNNGGMGPVTAFGYLPQTPYAGGYGLDTASGNYLAFPTHGLTYSPTAYRGRFPDLYSIGTAPVGASIPVGGPSQERIVVGDVVIPFVGGSPNL